MVVSRILKLWLELIYGGVTGFFQEMWPPWRFGKLWVSIGLFFLFQIILVKIIPGKVCTGPFTRHGNVPRYYTNGLAVYCITLVLFCSGSYVGFYKGGLLYDNLGPFLAAMNVLSLVLSFLFYFKGLFLPSSTDTNISGNPISDFYSGIELNPCLLGIDIKHFLVTRIGMLFWGLFGVSAIYKQREMFATNSDAILVNVGLQFVYLLKFYYFEKGYVTSIDMKENKVGFYQCWRSLAFLPSLYTSHTAYLVPNMRNIGSPICLLFFGVGLFCIYSTFIIDRERYRFRKAGAKCKIWDRDPYFITAKYTNANGEPKSSHILGSGWWGMSRHLNYVPEIGVALCWTIPVWSKQLLPYSYVIYLIAYLIDRAFRDDARCRTKYGKSWDIYCKRVPFIFVPGVL